MFERTLADLIRGLRASSKPDEQAFIAKAVDEIRAEVSSKDMELKAAAVLKLTYLDMLGYDMSWASFHVVEVMSSARIHLKTVGYLAAVQSFKDDTDVLMLTTNTLKKDLASPNPADIATALDGLSHIVTTDIARDLSLDLIAMLNHSRARIRKRAVLVMFKVFEKYPEAIPRSMNRLREKLEDPDPGVVSATVNILCELARRNPQDYLPLAPQLFDLLTKSSNNWMLIKLIKLLGALTPYEPRLVKKLLKPINELISTTPAVSLLYECVHTCIIGGMLQGNTTSSNALAKTCVNKLSGFLSETDQNLKYIALLAMVKIVPTHPHLVAVHQNDILKSLEDQDLSIRMRALDLVTSMVTSDNIKSIVQRLLSHLVPSTQDEAANSSTTSTLPSAVETLAKAAAPGASSSTAQTTQNPNQDPAYRRILAQRIIGICSQLDTESYSAATPRYGHEYDTEGAFDFGWYISVLVDLAYVAPASVDTGIGYAIRDQLLDVIMRVADPGVRKRTVALMARLLSDDGVVDGIIHAEEAENDGERSGNAGGGEEEVLWAAAWICGEFCSELPNTRELLSILLHNPNVRRLPERTQAAYLQSALKIFGHWAASLSSDWDNTDERAIENVMRVVSETRDVLEQFARSEYIEVQERAANMLQLFAFIKADITSHQNKQSTSTTPPTAPTDSTSIDPGYPKSLFLIQPLHARALHPLLNLGPLSTGKRPRVPIPEGLDLDAWIVPPAKLVKHGEGGDMEDQNGALATTSSKKKKGKEKSDGKVKSKSTKSKKTKDPALEGNSESAAGETPEEVAARARRKAQLAEERRNDPSYLVDDRPSARPGARPHAQADDDVDSIPVVKLDLGDLSPAVARSHPSTPVLRDLKPQGSFISVRSGPSTPVIGSTPREASPASTPPSSLLSSSILSSSLLAAARKGTPLSGGFAPYEDDEDGDSTKARDEQIPARERALGVSTPEPIKVTKVKKKKSTKSKSVIATPS